MEDKWTMRGLSEKDPRCIKTAEKLLQYIKEAGFLPLFRNEVPGFSVEENVPAGYWWTDDALRDPWVWRMTLAACEDVAYGKFYEGKAGFVSREWFPYFACVRRRGYDFDSRVDEGIAKPDDRRVMALFDETHASWGTNELKSKTELNKRFEPAVTRLMWQSYLVVGDFTQRVNKSGLPYGWHMSVYTTPEAKWGYDFVTSAYAEGEEKCKQKILLKLHESFPHADFGVIMGFGK